MQSTAGAVSMSGTRTEHGQMAGCGTGMGFDRDGDGLFQAKKNQQVNDAEKRAILPALQKRLKAKGLSL